MNIEDIPEPWRLTVILARDHAVAHMRVASFLGVIGELISAGWLVGWNRPDGIYVSLTPWAAEQLDVELVEFGLLETPRFVPIRYDLNGDRMEIDRPIVWSMQPDFSRVASLDYIPLDLRETQIMKREAKAREKQQQEKRKKQRVRELKRKAG